MTTDNKKRLPSEKLLKGYYCFYNRSPLRKFLTENRSSSTVQSTLTKSLSFLTKIEISKVQSIFFTEYKMHNAVKSYLNNLAWEFSMNSELQF